jgi:hypothetical protein
MKRLGCFVILILAMAIPNFCFGADAQDKQGIAAVKQQFKQSIVQLKDRQNKEFEQFKQQLMDRRKKELQEFREKLESQIPLDRQSMEQQLAQKKAALQKQTKQ